MHQSLILPGVVGLKHALVVGLCLSLLTFPSILSAPTTTMPDEDRMNSCPKWRNPCGVDTNNSQYPDGAALGNLADQCKNIIHATNSALVQAEPFLKTYTRCIMKKNESATMHSETHPLDNTYKWLPQLHNKTIDVPVQADELKKLKVSETLLDSYENLQKIAVGMEQVVWDEIDRDLPYKDYFFEASEGLLRNLLCEMQSAIYELGLTPKPDVDRNIMNATDRNPPGDTDRDKRNYVILRDYVNMLQYTHQVFTYIKEYRATD